MKDVSYEACLGLEVYLGRKIPFGKQRFTRNPSSGFSDQMFCPVV